MGNFTGPGAEETAQMNARALGMVHQLEEVMELDYEDVRELQARG